MQNLIDFFLEPYYNKPILEIILESIAFIFGIASVYYAKKENILVYPTGLVATLIAFYLLYKAEYFGDMMMNFYYSVMSIYGWWEWARKKENKPILKISRTNTKEKIIGVLLTCFTFLITYVIYITYPFWGSFFNASPIIWNDFITLINTNFFNPTLEKVQYVDIFTSGLFFTGMWYMAKKKLENWTLWIIADLITIPLYAYRGLGMFSLQFLIFTILAIQAYISWKKEIPTQKSIA